MKKITFNKLRNGTFCTWNWCGEYQTKPTYLHELAKYGLIFQMLLNCTNFNAKIGNTKIKGYTDKYGNKIIRYV